MKDIHRLNTKRRKKSKNRLRPRTCVGCSKEYQPKRSHQKYCTIECREDTYDKQRRWLPDPNTTNLDALSKVLSSYLQRVKCLPNHGKIEVEW